jgi:methylmalonyl-CoA/ethylmalonyl-CoA epimerase
MEEHWKLHHVGVVVKDVDQAIEYYKSLGATVSKPEIIFDNRLYSEIEVYGKPADAKLKIKIRVARMGTVALEFLQPVEGESITQEFLDTRGEGLQHLAFVVNNLDEEITILQKKGIRVIFSGRERATGFRFAYFETLEVGNTIIELVQP